MKMNLWEADRFLKKIEKALIVISWSTTLGIMFLTVIDITSRFFFNLPFPATWEVSEVLMPYIVVFGFAFTLSINAHVRATMFLNILPARAQKAITLFVYLLSCCTCMWLAWFSWIKFWRSFMINEEMMAAIRIPWWFGRFALPVGMAVFGIRYLMIIIKREV